MNGEKQSWQRLQFLPDKHVLYICVDEWKSDIPAGRILNACFTEDVSFTGFGDLLLTIEQLCDQLNLTKSTVELRHGPHCKDHLDHKAEWCDIRHTETPADASNTIWQRFGHARVFPVRIQYRMHATWQGVVQMDGKNIPFRSALELLNLLDDALWPQERN